MTEASFSDAPIEDATADRYDRAALVDEIHRTLAQRSIGESSTVYGLVGPWGSGKSSILNLTSLRLRESGWRVARFNPWVYSDTQSLQLGFFAELLSAVEDLLPTERARARRRKRRLTSLGRLMTATSPALGGISATLPVDIGGIAQGVGAALAGTTSASTEFASAENDLRSLNVRTLVIIDDLDRLDGLELALVMKLVRLVGRLPNIHYLLAYDEDTVLDVLGRTDLVGSGDRRRANAYLEKIVQRRFDVPPLRGAQIDLAVNSELERLQELFGQFDTAFSTDFSAAYGSHLRGRLTTPRAIARYFAQASGIDGATAREVDPSDYLVLTWLRLNEPGVYGWIIRDRDWFLHTGTKTLFKFHDTPDDERKQRVDDGLVAAGVHSADRAGIRDLLAQLFPAIRSDLARNHKRQGLVRGNSTRPRRLADADYFDRYFNGAVPADDIADAIVEQALHDIAAGATTESSRQLREKYVESTESVGRKIVAADSSSPNLLGWIADVFPDLPDRNDLLNDPQRFSRSLFTWITGQLAPGQVHDAISVTMRYPSGASMLADARDSIKRLAASVAYSVGRTEEHVIEIGRELDSTLDEVLWHWVEGMDSPFDQRPCMWQVVSALLERDPLRVRKWLRLKCEQSGWSAVDVVGANAPTSRVMGVPNAAWRLGEATADVASRLFDTEWLRQGWNAEAEQLASQKYIDLPASSSTRRFAGASAIRDLLSLTPHDPATD